MSYLLYVQGRSVRAEMARVCPAAGKLVFFLPLFSFNILIPGKHHHHAMSKKTASPQKPARTKLDSQHAKKMFEIPMRQFTEASQTELHWQNANEIVLIRKEMESINRKLDGILAAIPKPKPPPPSVSSEEAKKLQNPLPVPEAKLSPRDARIIGRDNL